MASASVALQDSSYSPTRVNLDPELEALFAKQRDALNSGISLSRACQMRKDRPPINML